MGKLYVFMGKSAAGKDTLYQEFRKENPEFKEVVPYTTRPMRNHEVQGETYHFVTVEELREMESQGKVIECRCYQTVKGDWYYFTADDGQIDFSIGNYCLISTLEGYEKIREYYGSECVEPVYIEVPDFIRIERALAREQQQEKPCVAEVCRRYLADEEDFSEENLKRAGISECIQNVDLRQALVEIREKVVDKSHKK